MPTSFLSLWPLIKEFGQIERITVKAVQKSDDCGWFVCHYIEEELRKAAGQPPQPQGWPTANRLSKLRAWLKRIIESIEHEREKMAKELVLQRAKDEKNALKAKEQ